MKKDIDKSEKIWYAECRGNRIDAKECWKWILDQGYKMDDGRILYRMWVDGGDRFIDVGRVYIFNENNAC